MSSFLPLELIRPGSNDRKVFPEAEIRELAESIAAHGLAQPVTVRPAGQEWEMPLWGDAEPAQLALISTPQNAKVLVNVSQSETLCPACSAPTAVANLPCPRCSAVGVTVPTLADW